jgi:hypothetical protein
MPFGSKKPSEDDRVNMKKDQLSTLSQMADVLDRLEKATAYGTLEPQAGEMAEQAQDPIEYVSPPSENNEDFKEVLVQLDSLKSRVNDRPLSDILKHYTEALNRKHRAWLWQQNYPDASLQDKDRAWLELEQTDEEAANLREYLNERIEQLRNSPLG